MLWLERPTKFAEDVGICGRGPDLREMQAPISWSTDVAAFHVSRIVYHSGSLAAWQLCNAPVNGLAKRGFESEMTKQVPLPSNERLPTEPASP